MSPASSWFSDWSGELGYLLVSNWCECAGVRLFVSVSAVGETGRQRQLTCGAQATKVPKHVS